MSEADKLKSAAAKLQKLASRLNRGWSLLHPAKAKHLEKVRAVVREQWAKKKEKSKGLTKRLKQQKSAAKKKSKSQSKDHGHSH